MKKLILPIFFAAALASCSSIRTTRGKAGTAQTSLYGTQWILAENVKGKVPTLVVESGRISGEAGCNKYFSTDFSANTADGSFSANNVGATRMACDNLNSEQNFLAALQQANKYVVNGNVLELYKDRLLLLRFNRK